MPPIFLLKADKENVVLVRPCQPFRRQVAIPEQRTLAGHDQRVLHLSRNNGVAVTESSLEIRQVQSEVLGAESPVEGLVGRDRIVASGRQPHHDLRVLGRPGLEPDPGADPMPDALVAAVLIDRLVPVAQVAAELDGVGPRCR